MDDRILRRFASAPRQSLGDKLDSLKRWLTNTPVAAEDVSARTLIYRQLRAAQQAEGAARERLLAALAAEFLSAADDGDASTLQAYVEAFFPLDVAEPGSGQTALHIAAAGGARACIEVLTASGRADYLVRDARGRLPSELAGVIADDPALAREMREKERAQAQAQGQSWTRRPR